MKPWRQQPGGNHAEISSVFEPKSRHVVNMVIYIIYMKNKQQNNKPQKISTYRLCPESDTWVPRQKLKLTSCFCRDTGGKKDAAGPAHQF